MGGPPADEVHNVSEVQPTETLGDLSAKPDRRIDSVRQAGELSFPGWRTEADRHLSQPDHRPGVARRVYGRALLRNRVDHAWAAQRSVLARDGQPVFLIVEAFERGLAEALCAAMAQQDKAIVGLEGRRIVGELKRPDRPRLDAGAPQ